MTDAALLAEAIALPPRAFRSLLADVPDDARRELLAFLESSQRGAVWDRIEDDFARSPRGGMHEAYRAAGMAQRRARDLAAQIDRLESYRAAHPIAEDEHDAAAIKARLCDPRDVATRLGLKWWPASNGGCKVRCPSHQEATPSCSLTRNEGTLRVRCFGCSFKGDLFTFVAAVRGLALPKDFRAAVAEAGVL